MFPRWRECGLCGGGKSSAIRAAATELPEKRDVPSLVGLDGDTVPGRGGLSVHEVDLLERQSLQAEKSKAH